MISHSDSPMRRKVGDMAKDRHGNKVFWNNIFALCEDLFLIKDPSDWFNKRAD